MRQNLNYIRTILLSLIQDIFTLYYFYFSIVQRNIGKNEVQRLVFEILKLRKDGQLEPSKGYDIIDNQEL